MSVVPSRSWQLQEAKARFSELVRRAHSSGPQWVTRHGKPAVVVLDAEQYEKLIARNRSHKSLVRFFADSPLVGSGIDLKRSPDYGRQVKL